MKTKTEVAKPRKPIREVVAENLRKWMAASPALETQMKLQEYSGVGQSSIQRIVNAEASCTVDVIEKLAESFGRDASDLIARPDTGVINFDRRAYAKLPDYEKARVEGFIQHVIDSYTIDVRGNSFQSSDVSDDKKQAIDRAIRKPVASKGVSQNVGGTRKSK